ncbi:hypothetical protein [Algoriphagus pacificus]|uniref:Alpha-galactosidase n=1 Tax=Algoriphagus pacificus TaxID=2811234 RepID=A0ABS3CJ22_9BACT|nr:hypothetical protein [Algoriphagus pacificus]MBN7816765.1 hypothetical protein [Algoriphagus pacificus]
MKITFLKLSLTFFTFFFLIGSKSFSQSDWLIDNSSFKAKVIETGDRIEISNGLVKRVLKVSPNAATIQLDNLVSGESFLRGVKPEAEVKINGVNYEVGGLKGQPNYAFLKEEWIDQLKNSPSSMQYVGHEILEVEAPFEWARVRYGSKDAPWPPKGVHIKFDYKLPEQRSILSSNDALPSFLGRKVIYQTEFNSLDSDWSTHISQSHPRSSYQNEGKIGEIYTPENTTVYLEREVSDDARIIEATFSVGTDKSKEYGPGITLVWPDRTIKFYLRPGGNSYDDEVPMFGLWDGEKEIQAAGGRQKLNLNMPWTLRFRITDDAVYCEAKPKDGDWRTIEKLPKFVSMPEKVRIGKTDVKGEGKDSSDPGELVRLQMLDFAMYSAIDLQSESQLDPNDVLVSVHYELYDGIPVFGKWMTVSNKSNKQITVEDFTSEIIAAVEYESKVELRESTVIKKPNIHVETDMAFSSMSADDANAHVVHWQPDPEYSTQVNYLRQTPSLLKVSPEYGPDQDLEPGKDFSSFRTFVLLYDSYDRERKGLAMRKMYKTLAPWTTENPLMMHARFADWERVKTAIDQASEVGFEMVILTFGSGFNIEDDSEEYIAEMKRYADYAKNKGVEIGGYSLLASRKIDVKNDVVMPDGMKPTFGNSPCIESEWGQAYFAKLYNFYEKSGFSLLEHDGSYPGDVCASEDHPGHKGLADSRWNQYRTISEFYRWSRSKGIYLNIPDYYFMTGGSKIAMGYREVNWSLPRNEQLVHARQNIFDGTWEKTSTMGWMFVPLTEYHGGGEAATIEPLNEHLAHYEMMMASNLGAGVQACYRGPRLFDTEETKNMVKGMVDWYKTHREVLEGDIIHLKRATGNDLDYWLNVNPNGKEKGMLVVYNPTDHAITKTIKVPLYYTGLTYQTIATFSTGGEKDLTLNRDYSVEIEVTVPGNSDSWVLFQ